MRDYEYDLSRVNHTRYRVEEAAAELKAMRQAPPNSYLPKDIREQNLATISGVVGCVSRRIFYEGFTLTSHAYLREIRMADNGPMEVEVLARADPAHLSIRSKPALHRLVRVATAILSNPHQIQIKGSTAILNSTKIRRLSSEGRSAAEKERMSKRTNICINKFKIVCKRLV